ncbi:iron-sulfur cluster-binding domain-containing protein [Pseudomonas abieticivorans]|uniref:iron-sulfur cluster-binding domain-containing protein n=1 Tax=Pseudomonas abieticivorans TaxID=2931382 RepID=UPI0020BE0BDA|nr:iron-sulfur cluster-binding domain-containing protein [Pseudomonas sp. PIA16]
MFDSLKEGGLVCATGVEGSVTVDHLLVHEDVVMLAGGIGITLPVALIRGLAVRHGQGLQVPRVSLLVCSPTITSIPFVAELLRLDLCSDWFSVRFHITQENIGSQSAQFHSGRPCLQDLTALGVPGAVVVCGGHGFALAQQAAAAKVYGEPVYLVEAFSTAEPVSADQGVPATQAIGRLRIENLGVEFGLRPGRTLLDELEHNGVGIRSQCRVGICGSCRVTIASGSCRRVADFALSPSERNDGIALACCTYPDGGDVVLELH